MHCHSRGDFFQQKLLLFVYSLYTFYSLIDESLVQIPRFIKGFVSVGTLVIMLFVFLFNNYKRINKQRLLFSLAVVVIFSAASLVTGETKLVIFCSLILCSYLVSFRRIVRSIFFASVIGLAVILFACLVGLIPNLKYSNVQGTRFAYCLGFNYYSGFYYHVFFCCVEYLYLYGKKAKKGSLILLVIINYLMYLITTVRLTWYLFLLYFIMFCIIVRGEKKNILNRKHIRQISEFVFPVGVLLVFYCMLFYKQGNEFWDTLNRIFSGRLNYMRQGFLAYQPKMFGQRIFMEGNALDRSMKTVDFYIDSGFAYSLLSYGILFTFFVTAIYTFMIKVSCRTNNTNLYLWLLCVMVFSLINNVWITVTLNPVLLYAAGVQSVRKQRVRRC